MECFYTDFLKLKSKNLIIERFCFQGIRLGIARDAKINERASFPTAYS